MSSQLDFEINNELGECYLFMGEMDKARDYYNKAMGSNGSHAEPYLGLATIEVQEGNLENARQLYTKAAEVKESDKAFAGLGLIEMEIGTKEAAYEYFQKALEINPENIIALNGLVQSGHLLEKVEEIIPHLQNYLQLDEQKSDVRYSLAGCFYQLGRTKEAVQELEQILGKDPSHEAARELLDQLR